MQSIKQLPVTDRLIRLSTEKTEEAEHAIASFFESTSVETLRDDLRTWYEAAISSNHPCYETGQARGNLFSLYYQLELLVEANYVLLNSKQTNQD